MMFLVLIQFFSLDTEFPPSLPFSFLNLFGSVIRNGLVKKRNELFIFRSLFYSTLTLFFVFYFILFFIYIRSWSIVCRKYIKQKETKLKQ